MVIKFWDLSVEDRISFISKLDKTDFLKLRQCSKEVDEFIEKHRFYISNKRNGDYSISISVSKNSFKFSYKQCKSAASAEAESLRVYFSEIMPWSVREYVDMPLYNPYQQLSALSAQGIEICFTGGEDEEIVDPSLNDQGDQQVAHETSEPVEPETLDDLLQRLKLKTGHLKVKYYRYPQKEEYELYNLIRFSSLEIDSGDRPCKAILPYQMANRPMKHLKLNLSNLNETSFDDLFEFIGKQKKVELSISEGREGIAKKLVPQLIKKMCKLSGIYSIRLFWISMGRLHIPTFGRMTEVWRRSAESREFVCFAKAFRRFIFVIYQQYGSTHQTGGQKIQMEVISKTKDSLRKKIETMTKKKLEEPAFVQIYDALVTDKDRTIEVS